MKTMKALLMVGLVLMEIVSWALLIMSAVAFISGCFTGHGGVAILGILGAYLGTRYLTRHIKSETPYGIFLF